MKKIPLLFSLSIIAILYQCTQNNAKKIITIQPEMLYCVNQLADSSYISDVRSILVDAQSTSLYFSDYNRDQVFKCDSTFESLTTIGRKGRGPGEFSGASHNVCSNDTIYTYNDAKKCFEVYKSIQHVKSIPLPTNINISNRNRFCKNGNDLFFSNPDFNTKSSITKLSISTGSTENFGEFITHETPKSSTNRNQRHLFIIDEPKRLIAISESYPIIEIYTLNGKLLSKHNYGEVDNVKRYIEENDKAKLPENTHVLLVMDAYIYNHNLFILTLSQDEDDIKKRNCNTLIRIDIVNNEVSVNKVISLPGGWYQSFCVLDQHLWAFNSYYGISYFKI